MTDDERAIRNFVDTWMAATEAGDLATVLNLMTDDVVFMVPGQKPFGKNAFEAAATASENVRIEGKSDIREIQICGDLGVPPELPGGFGNPARRTKAGAPLRLHADNLAQERRWKVAPCA